MKPEAGIEFAFAPVMADVERALDCTGLVLDVRPEWRSIDNNDHRLQIREALAHRCNDPSFLELSHLPSKEDLSVSISHCQLGGGYALCASPPNGERSLGFDLEDANRIRPAIVARVSLEHEIKDAPSHTLLWASKEATYKALRGPQQPTVIAELRIGNWRPAATMETSITTGNIWLFDGFLTDQTNPIPGQGAIFQLGNLIYAFFCRFHST